MQEIVLSHKQIERLQEEQLLPYKYQKLIDVFIWLIKEDKKQNPAFYKQYREGQND
jgi:hypothetical protein